MITIERHERTTGSKRRLAKKQVQCLNEILRFVSSLVLADCFVFLTLLLHQTPTIHQPKNKNYMHTILKRLLMNISFSNNASKRNSLLTFHHPLPLSYFLFLPLLLSSPTRAQTKITEGKLFYDIIYQNLSEELKNKESQLPHDASFYFKNSKSRIEMGAGPFGKNITITNQAKKETIVLLNIYGKKFAILKSDSEMIEVRRSFQNDTAKTTIKVDILSDTKKIAGYICTKAIITRTTNGIDKKTECWFTKELPPYNTQYDEAYKMIDGFLMQYNINEAGINMTMTVKMVQSIPIDDKMFEVPEGYRILTEKELMKVLNVLQQDQSGY